MTDAEKEKLKRFLNDKVMSKAVYDLLLASFLAPRVQKSMDADVMILAASRLAIDLLGEAWKELQKFKSEEEKEEKILTNLGV